MRKRLLAALLCLCLLMTAVPYGALAEAVGCPGGARAVGMANHCNPLPILVPCHRVVGSGGKLTGYAGGIYNKQWLLSHESQIHLL